MNKATVDYFGRKFDLGIVFDCYEGEDILLS